LSPKREAIVAKTQPKNVLSPKKETNVSKKPKRSLSPKNENIVPKDGKKKRSPKKLRNRSPKRIDLTGGVTDIEYDAD
jgi:hypothetical protein